MMMDLGPNLQRQAGALAATPGRGQEVVGSAIASRQAEAGGRIGSALDDALGQPADTLALADDIVARRANAAKPLYQKAYEEGSGGVWSPELERMAGRSPMFADAMRRAATTGQDRAIPDGFGSFNPRVSISQDGRISFNQAKAGGSPLYPDLQYWDYVKRNLDDVAGDPQYQRIAVIRLPSGDIGIIALGRDGLSVGSCTANGAFSSFLEPLAEWHPVTAQRSGGHRYAWPRKPFCSRAPQGRMHGTSLDTTGR